MWVLIRKVWAATSWWAIKVLQVGNEKSCLFKKKFLLNYLTFFSTS